MYPHVIGSDARLDPVEESSRALSHGKGKQLYSSQLSPPCSTEQEAFILLLNYSPGIPYFSIFLSSLWWIPESLLDSNYHSTVKHFYKIGISLHQSRKGQIEENITRIIGN